jgi:hypothetical protein
LLTAVLPSLAQEAPIGIVRGELLSRSGTSGRGEIVFRNAANQVYQCSFDEHSYLEPNLTRGDRVEVLSDRQPGTGICYARTVHLLEPAPAKRIPAKSTVSSAADLLAPRGNLTLAGVVLKVSEGEMLLRTRANERKVILLRADTRYLGGGQTVERTNLLVNTRVFIRAGRNLDDRVEAYQVVWGEILEPSVKPRVIP